QDRLVTRKRCGSFGGVGAEPLVNPLREGGLPGSRVHPLTPEHVRFDHRQPSIRVGLGGERLGRWIVAAIGTRISGLPAPGGPSSPSTVASAYESLDPWPAVRIGLEATSISLSTSSLTARCSICATSARP